MPGDAAQIARSCARCDYYGSRTENGNVLYLVIEANIYTQLIHLSAIPGEKVAELALV